MFAIKHDDAVPTIRTYEQALAHYESIKPIRGKVIRPIGNRRHQHRQILRSQGRGMRGIAARLYATNVVTWYEDGTLVIDHGGYRSASTRQFVENVLPWPVRSFDNQLLICIEGKEYPIGTEDTALVIKPDGEVISEVCVVHVVNRRALNSVRRKHKGLITYIRGALKLIPDNYEIDMESDRVEDKDRVTIFLKHGLLSNSEESWHKVLKMLLFVSRVWLWRDLQGAQAHWKADKKVALRSFDDLLKLAYRHKVFTTVLLPPGEYKKDPNAKYFED